MDVRDRELNLFSRNREWQRQKLRVVTKRSAAVALQARAEALNGEQLQNLRTGRSMLLRRRATPKSKRTMSKSSPRRSRRWNKWRRIGCRGSLISETGGRGTGRGVRISEMTDQESSLARLGPE